MKSSFAFFIPLFTISSVAAHGFLAQVKIDDGKTFEVAAPGQEQTESTIIRHVTDGEPINGAETPEINCGRGEQPAALVADANPGSKISFLWKGLNLQNWPHNIGPTLFYMASCGNDTCNNFDVKNAKWFKIDQLGKESDGKTWFQEDQKEGKPTTVTVPPNLASGNYIIQNHIIALHNLPSGPAEFYAGCAQLKVGGSQTGQPSPDELLTIPGMYKNSDQGIDDKTVFDPGDKYVFPGGPVATLTNNGANPLPSPSPSPIGSTDSGSSPTPSVTPTESPTLTNNGGAPTTTKKKHKPKSTTTHITTATPTDSPTGSGDASTSSNSNISTQIGGGETSLSSTTPTGTADSGSPTPNSSNPQSTVTPSPDGGETSTSTATKKKVKSKTKSKSHTCTAEETPSGNGDSGTTSTPLPSGGVSNRRQISRVMHQVHRRHARDLRGFYIH